MSRSSTGPGTLSFTCLVVALAGCASDSIPLAPPIVMPPSIPRAVVVAPDNIAVKVGDTLRMTASARGEVVLIVWATSDTLRATIDTAGFLAARSAGQVAVRATVTTKQDGPMNGVSILTIE